MIIHCIFAYLTLSIRAQIIKKSIVFLIIGTTVNIPLRFASRPLGTNLFGGSSLTLYFLMRENTTGS